jgi:predicted XRE-type DNA-binding protein
MCDDEFELVRGSGNVFRDLGEANAEVLQLKAILAGKIIEVLDEKKISIRRAHELTGFAAAEFSQVRQAKLRHIAVEPLVRMLAKLVNQAMG